MSYPRGARVDVALFGARTLAERHRELAAPWPPPEPDPALFSRRRRTIDNLSRLGLGLLLATDGGEWQTWQRPVDSEIAGWG